MESVVLAMFVQGSRALGNCDEHLEAAMLFFIALLCVSFMKLVTLFSAQPFSENPSLEE